MNRKLVFASLAGVTDPEEKRKRIGRTFIEIFEEEAAKLEGVRWLAQGTIYPDVIEPAGWELAAYRRNPILLWAHERRRPPIGRSLRTWVESGSLMAEIEFAPTPFAQEVGRLFERGFMRGVSVGFRPLEIEERRSSSGRRALRFVRQELLEISAAPLPMNADALSLGLREAEEATAVTSLREAVEELRASATLLE